MPFTRPSNHVGTTGQILILAGTDSSLVTLATLLAIWGRSRLPFLQEAADLEMLVRPWAIFLTAGWMLALALAGAYSLRHLGVGMGEYRRVLNASVLITAGVGVGAYLYNYPLSRGFFALYFLIGTPLLLIGRFALRRLLHRARRRGRFVTSAIVAGDLDHLEDLVSVLRRERWLGYDVVAALASDAREPYTPSGLPVVGEPSDALAALEKTGAEAVIFAEGSFPRAHVFNHMARALEEHNAQMIVVPALTDISAQRMHVRPVAGIPLVHVERPRAQYASRWLKRLFDLVGSSLLILISAPVMASVALAVRLEDGGRVFFRQERVGRHGEPFTCLKFRSMCVDAEAKLEALRSLNESDGDVLFKMANDPRITSVGRFIRRFSLDELPQFFNVWMGHMSLVGPRPGLQSEVDKYLPHVGRRLAVRPGMTGLWQISGRSDLDWDDTVRLDHYYVDNWSMLQDLNILLRTPGAVFRSRGAY